MGTRKAIVSPRALNADNIVAASTTEYEATREAGIPTPATTNTGRLLPLFSGDVEEATNLDIRLRTEGSAGAARFGHKITQAGAAPFKGKSAAHIIKNAHMLNTSNITNNVKRPKLLPLQNGKLLHLNLNDTLMYFSYRLFTPSTGWGSSSTQTTTVNSDTMKGISAVQLPTNEIVVFTLEVFGGKTNLRKWVAKDQDSIAFERSPMFYDDIGVVTTYVPVGIDVERMPSGRLVMLMQLTGSDIATNFSGLVSSVSDDGGITWSKWKRAGDMGIIPDDYTATLTTPPSSNGNGSPKIKLLQNGSLLAIAPARTGILNPMHTNLTINDKECMRLLVSDDGSSWSDLLRITQSRSIDDGGNRSFAVGFFPDGSQEGALAIGDDGLPKIFVALHGGTAIKAVGNKVYDDLCLYTLKKPNITSKDTSPLLPQGTSVNIITTSDAFDVPLNDTIPVTRLNLDYTFTSEYPLLRTLPNAVTDWAYISAKRINCNAYQTVSAGTNNLDNTPTYQGVKEVDAVNYRGAIWYSVASEGTTDSVTSITVFTCNSWSALQELPPQANETSANEYLLEGCVYRNSYLPTMEPDELHSNWVRTGVGATSMDPGVGGGGWKIASAADTVYVTSTADIADAPPDNDFFLRAVLIPSPNATAGNDNNAIRIVKTNNTNYSSLAIRFTTTAIYVVDTLGGPLTVATITGQDFSNGVEVVIRYTAYDTIASVFIKELSTDDGEVDVETLVPATAAYPIVLTPTAGSLARVEFGTFSAYTGNSWWKTVQYAQGTIATSTRLYAFLGTDAWDAAGTTLHEFYDDYGLWGKSVHDDGLRHGTRAPKTGSIPIYLTNRLHAFWRGGAGAQGDEWTITTASSYGSEKVLKAPVRDLWRTADDSAEATITFDALQGATKIAWFDPDALALFGFNAHKFTIEFDTQSDFNSAGPGPDLDIEIDTTGSAPADANRHYYKSTAFVSDDLYTIRLTGASLTTGVNPFSPGQFKSNDKVTWYMYSEENDRTYIIKDNDLTRLFFDEDVSTVVSGVKYIAIFPDKLAINLSGGDLSGGDGRDTGYRYMRIVMPVQTLAEGYFKLGFAIAGRSFDLADPHPDWNWTRTVAPSVSKITTAFGHKEVVQQSPSMNSWSYGFGGVRGSDYRADPTDPPDDRGGWQRWLNFLELTEWGAIPFALLPDYSNYIDSNTWGFVSFDVYPCIINGPWALTHQAYENCNSAAASLLFIKDIGDLAKLVFEEIL